MNFDRTFFISFFSTLNFSKCGHFPEDEVDPAPYPSIPPTAVLPWAIPALAH